ncbi:hypothetical protein AALO_G00157410 [Alosa alosa]|uniref:Uncharacterized protein n=1 Tax=Alosa alosa TaxID=278164 RepID=A0AAV6GHC5_9TELE|nr:uncharacterized protein LOC125303473 [Alosa alosa]KAG5273939.1 hypothetical protein AALO_G00157410 [Alosa alosa]
MPGTVPPSGGGQQQDQAVAATLDLICSAPEQTYSHFLASFTQLNLETLRAEEPRDTRRDAGPEVIRDGRKGDGDTNLRRQRDVSDLPELSNSLDNAALRVEDNKDDLQGCSLLPGEVENGRLPTHTSSIIHSTQLEMCSTANATHSTQLKMCSTANATHSTQLEMCSTANATHSTQLEMCSTPPPSSTPPSWRCAPQQTQRTPPSSQSGEHVAHSTSEPSGEHATPSADSSQGEQTTQPASSETESHTVTTIEQVWIHTSSIRGNTVTTIEQVDREEVQPFHLDDNFDYDHVVLTHKYPTLPQNPAAN